MYAVLNPYTDLQPRHCRGMSRAELDAFIRRGPGERTRTFAGALRRLAAIIETGAILEDESRSVLFSQRGRGRAA